MAKLDHDGNRYVVEMVFGLIPGDDDWSTPQIERLALVVARFSKLAEMAAGLEIARAELVDVRRPDGRSFDGIGGCVEGFQVAFVKDGSTAPELLTAAAELSRLWYELRKDELAAWHRLRSERTYDDFL